ADRPPGAPESAGESAAAAPATTRAPPAPGRRSTEGANERPPAAARPTRCGRSPEPCPSAKRGRATKPRGEYRVLSTQYSVLSAGYWVPGVQLVPLPWPPRHLLSSCGFSPA